VPDFPLQALLRAVPELAERPLVVATGSGSRDAVLAVSPEAAARGVRAGATVAQARQVVAEVEVRITPGEAAEAADEALADVAASFSPRVRRTRPGEVLFDVGGLQRRIGSEAKIAHELLRACRRVGLDGRVGLAGSCGVARIASRVGDGVPDPGPRQERLRGGSRGPGGAPPPRGGAVAAGFTVVEEGQERAFLAPLPLAVLEPPPDLMVQLLSWGVRRAGDLAALPRREVDLRLGRAGVLLHQLASGEPDETFIPDPVRETLKEGVHLDDPLVSLEAFLFVLRGLLSRLEGRLELRGEGFSEVLLEVALEGAERRGYRIALVAPAREVAAVVAMARLQLEAEPPGAPVEGVVVRVAPGRVRMVQGTLFGPRLPAPGKLAMTLARLAAVVGVDRIGAPAIADSLRPDAYRVLPFVPAPAGSGAGVVAGGEGAAREAGPGSSGWATASRSHGGSVPWPRPVARHGEGGGLPGAGERVARLPRPVLRALRPAREAYVVTARERPVVARVEGRGGAVVECAGPYRIVGEWWGDDPFARDEFDVATADGAVFRIFFDRLAQRWYADGFYD